MVQQDIYTRLRFDCQTLASPDFPLSLRGGFGLCVDRQNKPSVSYALNVRESGGLELRTVSKCSAILILAELPPLCSTLNSRHTWYRVAFVVTTTQAAPSAKLDGAVVRYIGDIPTRLAIAPSTIRVSFLAERHNTTRS